MYMVHIYLLYIIVRCTRSSRRRVKSTPGRLISPRCLLSPSDLSVDSPRFSPPGIKTPPFLLRFFGSVSVPLLPYCSPLWRLSTMMMRFCRVVVVRKALLFDEESLVTCNCCCCSWWCSMTYFYTKKKKTLTIKPSSSQYSAITRKKQLWSFSFLIILSLTYSLSYSLFLYR